MLRRASILRRADRVATRPQPPRHTFEKNDGYTVFETTTSPDGSLAYRSRIYLADCVGVVRYDPEASVAFSHEILHALHPTWPHPRVYAEEDEFVPVMRAA